jgi:hypothetical protein
LTAKETVLLVQLMQEIVLLADKILFQDCLFLTKVFVRLLVLLIITFF